MNENRSASPESPPWWHAYAQDPEGSLAETAASRGLSIEAFRARLERGAQLLGDEAAGHLSYAALELARTHPSELSATEREHFGRCAACRALAEAITPEALEADIGQARGLFERIVGGAESRREDAPQRAPVRPYGPSPTLARTASAWATPAIALGALAIGVAALISRPPPTPLPGGLSALESRVEAAMSAAIAESDRLASLERRLEALDRTLADAAIDWPSVTAGAGETALAQLKAEIDGLSANVEVLSEQLERPRFITIDPMEWATEREDEAPTVPFLLESPLPPLVDDRQRVPAENG